MEEEGEGEGDGARALGVEAAVVEAVGVLDCTEAEEVEVGVLSESTADSCSCAPDE